MSTMSEDQALDAYRAIYSSSGPVLRLLQTLLVVLSRAHNHAAAYPLSVPTILLVFPVLRALLLLPNTMPGTEHSFHLLER
jgi:hypothetical protein